MALGQLLVELGLNTVAFKGGCDKATYMAKAAANEIKASFREIGSAFSELGASMGGVGGQIASSLGAVSRAIDPLLKSFGSIGSLGAAVLGSFVIAGAGAIATAVHFSETAAKASELSHATGLTTEAISSLGNVAATRGVSMEQLAHGLERMSRSALQAAKNPQAASNAYREFGIAIQDSSGHMLKADEILANTADRFSEFEDGPQKTAAAIKIFGRAGAEMIGLLDLGGEHIQKMKKDFDELGATISSSTGEGGVRLKENMTLMSAAFTGFENDLTTALLPALNEVGAELVSMFKGSQGGIKAFAEGVADVARGMLIMGQAVGLVFTLFVDGIELTQGLLEEMGGSIKNIAASMLNLGSGNFKAAWENATQATVGAVGGMYGKIKEFAHEAAEDSTKTFENMRRVALAQPEPEEKKKGKKELPPPVVPEHLEWIRKQAEAFVEAGKRAEDLAGKIGLLGAEEMEFAASAKAATEIEKLHHEALVKAQARYGENAKESAKARAEIDKYAETIKQAALKQEVFNAVLREGEALHKFGEELEKQIRKIQDNAAAISPYEKEMGALNKKLDEQKEKVAELTDEYNRQKLNGKDNAQLLGDIGKLNEQVDKTKELIKGVGDAIEKAAIADITKKATLETERYNEMLKPGPDYINAAVAKTKELTHGWDAVAAAAAIAAAKEEAATEHKVKVGEGAVAEAKKPQQEFDDKKTAIAALMAYRAELVKNHQSVADVDVEIRKLILDMDKLNARAGGLASVKLGFTQFIAESRKAGEAISHNITKALDGVATGFAKSVVAGRGFATAMREVGKQFAEEFLAMEMKRLMGAIMVEGQLLAVHIGANKTKELSDKESALKSIIASAKSAAVKGWDAGMKFPPPLNFVMAPAFAAAAFAGAMAVGSFEQGGIVPATGMAKVHENEMVLPRPISEKVQKMTDDKFGHAGSITVHYSPTVHAVDGKGVGDMLNAHGHLFTQHIVKEMRRRNL